MRLRWGAGWCGVVRLVLAAGVTAPFGAEARGDDDGRALTATIDRLVAARWDEARVSPSPPADDGEFLRRVALDLTGKIPTAGEVRAFLDDPRADKRERLVERLLDGPAYITHATNVELRLMIPEVDSDPQAQALAPAFEAWLRGQVAANAGSDRIVRAILTASVPEGRARPPVVANPARPPEPSPLPFYVAKDVKSENIAASTARLFLGLRLECAQCHNHPFASWTRDQFWGYAAFFASLERGDTEEAPLDPIRERADRREVAIPGAGGRVVKATFLDGGAPRLRPQEPPRMALADWMTAPENPYFARAAVNRIWAQLFGIGLVDPVDDMGADNPPSHPELLDALARSFAEHGFDRKFLIRAIALSRPYQLTSRASEPGASPGGVADDPRLFARMRERGLTAEQLYDSLAEAIGLTPEELGPGRFSVAADSPRGEFLERFARHDEPSTEAQTTILQALALMNGRVVAGATHLERGATLSAVAEAPFLDTAGRVEALFLATVSRRPKPEEAARMAAYVERGGATGDRRKALADVFWALLNSPEFLLNH
jgi:hypothetical protein